MSEKTGVKKAEESATAELEAKEDKMFVQPRYSSRKLEDVDAYEVAVVLPGVTKKGLEISAEDGELTIVGKRGPWVPEGWRPVSGESLRHVVADYRLILSLNVDIDDERITAKLEDGILTLRLPVSEASKPKLIEVV